MFATRRVTAEIFSTIDVPPREWQHVQPSFVQGNHPRVAVATERLTEEGFGGGDVAGAAKVGLNRFALFVDGAVKVKPLAAQLEVGLVHAPALAPCGDTLFLRGPS